MPLFKPSIQKLWRSKIAKQSAAVEKCGAALAPALQDYAAASSKINRIQAQTHKLVTAIVIPADPGIRKKYHNLTGDKAAAAINNGLTGEEFDLVPKKVTNALKTIMDLQIGLFEGPDIEVIEYALRKKQDEFNAAERELRKLTVALDQYVKSKDAMKAIGPKQYEAWKKVQKNFLDSI